MEWLHYLCFSIHIFFASFIRHFKHDLVSTYLKYLIWGWYLYIEKNGNQLQYSCLENPVDGGGWWAAVHSVAQLKQLSMHACIGEGNGNPLLYSCLENPRLRGAWLSAISGVAQSWTRLKQLSSSNSRSSSKFLWSLLSMLALDCILWTYSGFLFFHLPISTLCLLSEFYISLLKSLLDERRLHK